MIGALILATAICNPSLWQHTYHRERFTIIATCKTFSGVIEHVRHEPDGDDHIQLRLDPGQGHPLNHANVAKQKSCLVVEPVCVHRVTQRDAIAACEGSPVVDVPKRGAHVRATGVYVVDNPHGWIELHAATLELISP